MNMLDKNISLNSQRDRDLLFEKEAHGRNVSNPLPPFEITSLLNDKIPFPAHTHSEFIELAFRNTSPYEEEKNVSTFVSPLKKSNGNLRSRSFKCTKQLNDGSPGRYKRETTFAENDSNSTRSAETLSSITSSSVHGRDVDYVLFGAPGCVPVSMCTMKNLKPKKQPPRLPVRKGSPPPLKRFDKLTLYTRETSTGSASACTSSSYPSPALTLSSSGHTEMPPLQTPEEACIGAISSVNFKPAKPTTKTKILKEVRQHALTPPMRQPSFSPTAADSDNQSSGGETFALQKELLASFPAQRASSSFEANESWFSSDGEDDDSLFMDNNPHRHDE